MSKNNKDQNKNRIKSLEHLNCTVTGLPVTQKSEWTNLTFGQDNYRMTYSLIGQNIILSKVKGYTNLHACKEYFLHLEKVVVTAVQKADGFILIEDYTDHIGASMQARSHYMVQAKRIAGLKGVIFCTIKPLLKMMIKIGKTYCQAEFSCRNN